MQLNTTAALITAVVSVFIGFGFTFYIERKISSRMQMKSQKILVYLAMISFGYGLTAALNEVIGVPLQGLHIRYEKLAGLIVANIIFFPIIFLVIAKLIGIKNKVANADLRIRSSLTVAEYFKYFLMLFGLLSIVYFGFTIFGGKISSDSTTYDFYVPLDYKNCNSPYEEKPGFSLRFAFKKETNEIFMTIEMDVDGVKKMQIQPLNDCSILNSENWTCGGKSAGSYISPLYAYVDGVFSYVDGQFIGEKNCPSKYKKR
jgi:hypothetical protein